MINELTEANGRETGLGVFLEHLGRAVVGVENFVIIIFLIVINGERLELAVETLIRSIVGRKRGKASNKQGDADN